MCERRENKRLARRFHRLHITMVRKRSMVTYDEGRRRGRAPLCPPYLSHTRHTLFSLIAGEAAAHRGRLIALSVEAMANECVGLEGRDLSRMAARVGGAEAAPIRAEGALGADAALALGAAEPEVGACGERRIEVIHQVRAERGGY